MGATTAANEAIKDRLDDWLQFHPANAKLLVPAWVLDPGDIVTVENEGVEYKLPIYNLDVEWKGESTGRISSTGKEKRPPLSELKRRSYAGQKQTEEQQAQIDDVIYKTDFTKTDEGIGMLASAVGVKIDPATGKPSYNSQTGKWEFDANGATLTGQLNIKADAVTTEVTQARGDSSTLSGRLGVMADQISLVVTGTGANATVNTASIVLAINGGTGHSSAAIEADSILLTGNVTLNGALNITNGELVSSYPISTTSYLKGSSLTLSGTSAVSVTPDDLDTMLVKADVDTTTNTLKIWKRGDPAGSPSITFSKATTSKVSGGWSGGNYVISANPNGSNLPLTLTITNAVSAVSNTVYSSGTGLWYGDVTVTPSVGGSAGSGSTYQINVQDAVNTGVGAGWANAALEVVWPSASTSSSFDVTVPDVTWNDTTGKTFTLRKSGAYAYCSDGTNDVARVSVTGSVSAAAPQSTQPTTSGAQELRTVTVGTGGNYAYVKVSATGYRNNDDYITIKY